MPLHVEQSENSVFTNCVPMVRVDICCLDGWALSVVVTLVDFDEIKSGCLALARTYCRRCTAKKRQIPLRKKAQRRQNANKLEKYAGLLWLKFVNRIVDAFFFVGKSRILCLSLAICSLSLLLFILDIFIPKHSKI